jgi:hypothetical protein
MPRWNGSDNAQALAQHGNVPTLEPHAYAGGLAQDQFLHALGSMVTRKTKTAPAWKEADAESSHRPISFPNTGGEI